jgi:superfamily II DNA or RNA helicase
LWHLGFDDVRIVDGSGDGGADILAVRGDEQWVFQSKWSKSGNIDEVGVEDLHRAYSKYTADNAVLVTNRGLSRQASERVESLKRLGLRVHVWNGATASEIGARMPERVLATKELRSYQQAAVAAIERDLYSTNSAFLVLATGLGKTVVGGEVISNFLKKKPDSRILVLSHLKELSSQLERAMWQHLPKTVPTNLLTGDSKPTNLSGLTAATVNSALNAVTGGYTPDLIMIDETHHVGEQGLYHELLRMLPDVPRFGVTATPWRGDEFDITQVFGPPSYQMGIPDGMNQGWLSDVDYRLFVDNIDWELIRNRSRNEYSIRELNRKLFLPQRDSLIIEEIRRAWQQTNRPRAIIFCATIDHAEHMAELMRRSDPAWMRAESLHSEISSQQRNVLLNRFRLGRTPLLTCVDVLNEGVDVPDVNLIAFLRVTHSRRIFVQQLGRGLRLAKGKKALKVLDFVTDIRRVAAALALRRELESKDREFLSLEGTANQIKFNDATSGTFLDHWLKDAADIETAADEVILRFPETQGIH